MELNTPQFRTIFTQRHFRVEQRQKEKEKKRCQHSQQAHISGTT